MLKFLKKRWYIVVLFIILIVGYRYQQHSIKVKSEAELKAYTVKRQNLQDTVSLSGTIDADEKATVRFLSAGKVVWLGVKEGDEVKKYQGIASLDTRDVNDRIQKYLNSYLKTRSQFDQVSEDNKDTATNGISPELREQAKRLMNESQGDLNNAVLDYEIQNLAKESSYLYSPIDGIVTKAPISVAGIYISLPTQAEFEIVNPASLYFSASADQTDVVKLTDGMSGQLVFDAYPDTTVDGSIESIAFTPEENETGTAYQVKMKFSPTALKYKMGMTGDATFILKEKQNVIVIPETYLKTDKNGTYVLKKQGSKSAKQYVETGEKVEGDVEIISGLQEGDQIYD